MSHGLFICVTSYLVSDFRIRIANKTTHTFLALHLKIFSNKNRSVSPELFSYRLYTSNFRDIFKSKFNCFCLLESYFENEWRFSTYIRMENIPPTNRGRKWKREESTCARNVRKTYKTLNNFSNQIIN